MSELNLFKSYRSHILYWKNHSSFRIPFRSPITEAYYSALHFATGPHYSSRIVTRAEYMESGTTRRKFRDWKNPSSAEVQVQIGDPPPNNDERQQTTSKSTRTRARGNVATSTRQSRR